MLSVEWTRVGKCRMKIVSKFNNNFNLFLNVHMKYKLFSTRHIFRRKRRCQMTCRPSCMYPLDGYIEKGIEWVSELWYSFYTDLSVDIWYVYSCIEWKVLKSIISADFSLHFIYWWGLMYVGTELLLAILLAMLNTEIYFIPTSN